MSPIQRNPTQATLEAIAEAERIIRGEIPNTTTERQDRIVGLDANQAQLRRIVDMGRFVADPGYVKVVEWDIAKRARDHLWWFHLDAISLFAGKKIDLLSQFFALLEGTKAPPIMRVMFPRQIMVSGWGGTMDQSLLAMAWDDVAKLLKPFIVQWTYTRRFTKEQRANFLAKTGKELLDQYWEVLGHEVEVKFDERPLKFMLFLPSGLEFAIFPVPATDPVQFTKTDPDPNVRLAGMATLTKGYADLAQPGIDAEN